MLMNKADLLPEALRLKWADYFDSKGIKYVFWSAYRCIMRQKAEKTAAAQAMGYKVEREAPSADSRVTVLDEEGLLAVRCSYPQTSMDSN